MNGGKRPLGYTIIEVMIVLAVSGLMFVIAGNFISGKQAKTSFNSGSNEMASRVTDVIGQVNSGHYSDQAFTCVSSSDGSPPQIKANDANQSARSGKNFGCVFLGKLIHFKDGEPTKYEVFSLTGNRLKTGDKPAINLADVTPTIIKSNDGTFDLTLQQTVPQQLDVKAVKVDGRSASGFGFVQGLGTATVASDANYESGSQSIRMVYTTGVITSNTPSLSFGREATICLSDDTRWAVVTVTLSSATTKFYGDPLDTGGLCS
ncbi:MAG: hypothetical protein JWO35_394 [Candidatus Saccharibacteria bacterium]|nr:hypothetical protein [Candidatus Saccharibacteria bacterium]